jgi:galactokinase
VSAAAASLRGAFRARFGADPAVFRAPGRVNLIGEHTDYNGGYVLPAAIALYTYVAVAPRRDGQFRILSAHFPDEVRFDPRNAATAGAAQGGSPHWSDYVTGVIRVLLDRGVPLQGADLMVEGEIPLGSGLSSSAALELATALALSASAGREMSRTELARIGQEAENVHVGMRCGIMDQFASAHGRAGHALLLDCRTLEHRILPLAGTPGGAVEIVTSNSMVRHQLAGSEYNRRRSECEAAVKIFARHDPAVRELRDVDAGHLEACRGQLDEVLIRRCRHVVTENARVLAAAEALTAGDVGLFGGLMRASHRSLRDDYEVSCRELDELVRIAERIEGVLGTRMTGGGFGGCTVSLVRSDAVERFRTEVGRAYARATGFTPDITVCASADGAAPVPTS